MDPVPGAVGQVSGEPVDVAGSRRLVDEVPRRAGPAGQWVEYPLGSPVVGLVEADNLSTTQLRHALDNAKVKATPLHGFPRPTARALAAVRAGERVTLTMRGEPIAHIVPHGGRTRGLVGSALRDQLAQRAADNAPRADLDELAGQTLAEL